MAMADEFAVCFLIVRAQTAEYIRKYFRIEN